MIRSGATQWRVDCTCAPTVAEQRDTQKWQRMHSQVSSRNADYFIEEDRLAANLDEEQLRERLSEAAGPLLCCNVCGTLKELDATRESPNDSQQTLGGRKA